MSSHCLKVAAECYPQSVTQSKGRAVAHQRGAGAALLRAVSWKEFKLPQSI